MENDYKIVKQIIEYLHDNFKNQPDMSTIAHDIGIPADQLAQLFQSWAGISPMGFLQALSIDHARRLLSENASVMDTSYEIGHSSPSRLYDLFVTHEAMTPGQFKHKGQGLKIYYDYAPSPFGLSLMVVTDKGLAGIGFAEDNEKSKMDALIDMQSRWPNADFIHSPNHITPYKDQVFNYQKWSAENPIKIVLIGTDFEIRVWQELLKIPFGGATTYGTIAKSLDKPKAARAVGTAVGKNPISFVVPCHRVVGSNGAITGYHWGLTRKRAMLGWECGIKQQ